MLLGEKARTIEIAKHSLDAAREYVQGQRPSDPWFTSTLGISDEEKAGILNQLGSRAPEVDPVVQFLIGATSGHLYKELIGTIGEYPIPNLRMAPGAGKRLLDIGCSWGRWSMAGVRRGYRVMGIDPSLGAVLAARRVSRQLGLAAEFVVADARFLPFANDEFDAVFSYSVIQHFSKADACTTLSEIARVLKSGGVSLVQMPNKFGLRSLYHQTRRGFRPPADFEVRYWSLSELRDAFESELGSSAFSADCFLGLGLQRADARFMSRSRRCLISMSESLRLLSTRLPALTYVADSIYIESRNA